jgi:hypothetical protein
MAAVAMYVALSTTLPAQITALANPDATVEIQGCAVIGGK